MGWINSSSATKPALASSVHIRSVVWSPEARGDSTSRSKINRVPPAAATVKKHRAHSRALRARFETQQHATDIFAQRVKMVSSGAAEQMWA